MTYTLTIDDADAALLVQLLEDHAAKVAKAMAMEEDIADDLSDEKLCILVSDQIETSALLTNIRRATA